MKAWMGYALCLLAGCAIGSVACALVNGRGHGGGAASTLGAFLTARTDTVTVTRTDTVRVADPVPSPVSDTVTVYRTEPFYRYLTLVERDTVWVNDTVWVELPITRREYRTEDYDLWISGYRPSLDSLYLYRRTETVTIRENARRWGLGVTAGYGLSSGGLSPFVGLGLYYRLW